MPVLDDLRLNDDPSEPGPPLDAPAGPSPWIPAIVILAIIAIGAVVLLWPKGAPAPQPKPAAASDHAVTAPPRVQPEPGENIALPPLDESDPLVRQLVSLVSTHPRVATWLATSGLLRNFAATVANIAEGETPIKQLARQRPDAKFTVRETAGGTFIDPASYRRYDSYADAVAGLDPRGTARLYATLKPRIADAYKDLGYPDGNIDGALARAITLLLRTPEPGENIRLKRPSVMWEYADPALESLPQAQRQLIRMGPRNQKIIQDKLREIAPYLGVDTAR